MIRIFTFVLVLLSGISINGQESSPPVIDTGVTGGESGSKSCSPVNCHLMDGFSCFLNGGRIRQSGSVCSCCPREKSGNSYNIEKMMGEIENIVGGIMENFKSIAGDMTRTSFTDRVRDVGSELGSRFNSGVRSFTERINGNDGSNIGSRFVSGVRSLGDRIGGGDGERPRFRGLFNRRQDDGNNGGNSRGGFLSDLFNQDKQEEPPRRVSGIGALLNTNSNRRRSENNADPTDAILKELE